MKKNISALVFFIIFAVSIPLTAIFWFFFSNTGGFDPQTEMEVAVIINREFKEGDIVFPIPDWDIGFTEYLRDGITDISYTLHSYDKESIAELNNNGTNCLIIISDSETRWQEIKKRLELKELQRFTAGKAIVVRAQTEKQGEMKLFDFVDNIAKAKEVYLAGKDNEKTPCKLEGERWQCSEEEWSNVSSMRSIMGGKWQKALWAHPRTEKTTHIIFENNVNAGEINLGTAFLERAYHEANGDPIEVEVFADGKSIIKYTNQNIDKYYKSREKLPEGTKIIDITFYVKFDGARHFVFNGYLGK